MKKLILILAFLLFTAPVYGENLTHKQFIQKRIDQNAHVKAAGGRFSGNIKTKIFHSPRCRFYDCRDCSASFKTREQALQAGYAPCQKCGGYE